MRGYTVKQVAKLSGVSVRTLHHYDEIGLLKPESVGANGYRYYGRDDLLRLQQILFHRELGFPLAEIGKVLDAPDFDRVAALKRHRERLEADTKRYSRLVRTIDETLAALQGATTMDDKGIYQGFDRKKQAQHEAWLKDRYGPGMQATVDKVKANIESWPHAEIDAFKAELEVIEAGMAQALTSGLPADSAAVQALARRHHAWVGRTWPEPPIKAGYLGLAGIYEEHPDFRARYEGRAAGLTEYLTQAMRVFAERELS